jgi:AraC-like DNA-binding protein/tetratricopeptide (TPR) repeat protein
MVAMPPRDAAPPAARDAAGRTQTNTTPAIGRAVATLHALLAADPAASPSTAALAASAGVAPRTLQRHLRAALGTRPKALARRLRLGAARDALLAGEATSVIDVALQHGFANPGRFAVAYREAFGESPSATLRAARARRGGAPRPGDTGPLIELRPVQDADAARARRATDELAMALCRRRDLSLRDPAAPVPAAEARRLFRLEARIDADRVVLTLAHPARGVLVWTGQEAIAPLHGLAWPDRAAAAVRAALEEARVEEARRAPRRAADTETLVTRARPAALSLERGTVAVALDLLNDALHRDPAHPVAHALAGWSHAQSAMHNFVRDPAAERARAHEHAERAVALAPDDPEVLTHAAAVLSLMHRLNEAERLAMRAITLDPTLAEAQRRLGWIRVYQRDAAAALPIFRRTLRLFPDGRNTGLSLVGIGMARFIAEDYARAARAFARALDVRPTLAWVNRLLAAAAIEAGAAEAARRSVAALQRAFPDITVGQVGRSLMLDPLTLQRMLDGLARAGLPR